MITIKGNLVQSGYFQGLKEGEYTINANQVTRIQSTNPTKTKYTVFLSDETRIEDVSEADVEKLRKQV